MLITSSLQSSILYLICIECPLCTKGWLGLENIKEWTEKILLVGSLLLLQTPLPSPSNPFSPASFSSPYCLSGHRELAIVICLHVSPCYTISLEQICSSINTFEIFPTCCTFQSWVIFQCPLQCLLFQTPSQLPHQNYSLRPLQSHSTGFLPQCSTHSILFRILVICVCVFSNDLQSPGSVL